MNRRLFDRSLIVALLLAFSGRQFIFVLHHPHKEFADCELLTRKNSRGDAHFHEQTGDPCWLNDVIAHSPIDLGTFTIDFKIKVPVFSNPVCLTVENKSKQAAVHAYSLRGPPDV